MESIFSELTNIDSLLNDFNVSVSDYMQSMEFDESEFHEVEDRLNTINNKRKIRQNDRRCACLSGAVEAG